eukprot:TRINITY_DN4101_c0_g1_i2.p1 TRINITY_DN4101_c0_g1~~TRINITY_DN4101_c0_g1_i2.p1  ORF type:complete len:125 (+),score=14.88 TRINITY_DN4101_c0_g1_i2:265-639(+)
MHATHELHVHDQYQLGSELKWMDNSCKRKECGGRASHTLRSGLTHMKRRKNRLEGDDEAEEKTEKEKDKNEDEEEQCVKTSNNRCLCAWLLLYNESVTVRLFAMLIKERVGHDGLTRTTEKRCE